MSWKPYTHDHPQLGPLTGRLWKQPTISETAEVVHFRSIPFATIPERFKLAQLLYEIPDTYDVRPKGDFTEWGFACPQIEQPTDAGGGPLPEDGQRRYDEFACLNLTITAPRYALENLGAEKLPVMVYLHGGAFVEGCGNISAGHDTSRMVALSIEEGMPVVMVNVHYRLNWFGFFTCSDLINEDGFTPNLGLRDQRLAFQWVQRQIAGFGGDPNNVTAFGESAGSISLVHHLCGTEPLFNRVSLQSGVVLSPGGDLVERDKQYEKLCEYLSIRERSPGPRLMALRAAPVGKLLEALVDLHAAPMWPYTGEEDDFYATGFAPQWSTVDQRLRDCTWCKEIVIGDASFEGYMLFDSLRSRSRKDLFNTLSTHLKPSDADSICAYYGLTNDSSDNLFWTNTARFLGDIGFSEPTDKLATALSTSPNHHIYRHQVCLSNPFPGSSLSFVPGHHFVEVFYLFLNYLEHFPPHRGNFFAKTAMTMARRWIAFANGEAPWTEYGEETGHAIAIFDDLRGFDVRSREQDEEVSKADVWGERRYEGWRLIRKALENVGECDRVRAGLTDPFYPQ